jgi:hypothetical protein
MVTHSRSPANGKFSGVLKMEKFTVAVTGDTGTDTYTRYVPGYISDGDEELHPEIAHDLEVPSGARFIFHALRTLLSGHGFEFLDRAPNRSKPTLPETLQFLHSCKWFGENPIRISRVAPLKRPEPKSVKDGVVELDNRAIDADCLVVHDATRVWRKSKDARDLVSKFMNAKPRSNGKSAPPRVIVNLATISPELAIDGSDNTPPQHKMHAVWEELFLRADEVCVVLSITPLRHAGAAISRRLSWERTIEDTMADLQLFDSLRVLSRFRNVIIRFGFVGALHIENPLNTEEKDEPRDAKAQFIFAPNARDGVFRDPMEDGRIVGKNACLIASLLKQIKMSGSGRFNAETIAISIQTALTLGMTLFDRGFPCTSSSEFRQLKRASDTQEDRKAEREHLGERFLTQFFSGDVGIDIKGCLELRDIMKKGYDGLLQDLKHRKIRRDRVLGRICVPPEVVNAKPGDSGHGPHAWQILRSQVRKDESVSRINLGIAICKFGHQHVLNRPLRDAFRNYNDNEKRRGEVPLKEIEKILLQPECILSANEIADDKPLKGSQLPAVPHPTGFRPKRVPSARSRYIPVMEFGQLVAIERDEIESFRSLRNLMKLYVEAQGRISISGQPISVAVFGAPGSGKSFAVKQIAASINRALADSTPKLETIECNVAQFRTVEDLGQAITRIISVNNERKVPLVFFDEFDCEFERKPLGWLKYFLAPMQDGTFYGASQTISFGRAIFVFAGGIYRTIAEFDPFTESPAEDSDANDVEAQLKRQALFTEQKGPDFVSRLRGHINIMSVNPDDTSPLDEDGLPIKPIIRRALTLRGQIIKGNWVVERDGCPVANIDNDILYALLTIDHYRHGTRSMEAILQMCMPMNGVIEKASLPSRAQLNMHVDADEFFIRLFRGRFRSSLVPISKHGGKSFHTSEQPTDAKHHDAPSKYTKVGYDEPPPSRKTQAANNRRSENKRDLSDDRRK